MNRQSSKISSFTMQNIGFFGRELRMVIGVALIASVFAVPAPIGLWALAPLIAVPIIMSAIMAWDPVYALVNRNTRIGDQSNIHQRTWSSPNIGTFERGLRIVVGAAMIAPMMLSGGMADVTVAALALAAIPVMISAMIAWDPLYAIGSINTFSSKSDVASVGPELDEGSLARVYEFESLETGVKPEQYPSKAA